MKEEIDKDRRMAVNKGEIRELRGEGVLIGIDDFGRGSIGYKDIEEIEPDYIKIDKYYIRGIGNNRLHQEIVSGVLGIGRCIGSGVVAEGIESEEELGCLRSIGIELYQGYYWGKGE